MLYVASTCVTLNSIVSNMTSDSLGLMYFIFDVFFNGKYACYVSVKVMYVRLCNVLNVCMYVCMYVMLFVLCRI